MTKWRKIRVAADVYGVLWAGLNAGVALPTEVGLDVVGSSGERVDVHDIRGTDFYALPAAIALRHICISRHGIKSLWDG